MKRYLPLLSLVTLILFSCQEKVVLIKNSKGEERTKKDIDIFFKSLMDSLNIPGMSVAIINDSKINYHETFGVSHIEKKDSVNYKTLFEAASLSKPLFAYFAMNQVQKGILDLDKPLHQYLSYSDIEHDERYKQITARMILSHSSGLPNWREDSLKIHFTPGTNYMYSGEGYKYLAKVLAKINNVELSELQEVFQKEIAFPVNTERLYFKWNDDISSNKAFGHINNKATTNKRDHKDNDFGAAGGLHTEATNYANFIISIFENQIISPTLKNDMFSEQIKLPDDDINKIVIGATGWSLGFGMIPTSNNMCYWHAGNNDDFQSWMHFFPDKKYGIVLFTNADKLQSPDFFEPFFSYLNDEITFDLSSLK